MKKSRNHLWAIAVPLLLGASAAFAELPAGWSTDFTNTLQEAKSREQPVLVYFTTSWCPGCKLMARTTFAAEAVTRALGGLHHVAVDIEEHPDVAQKYGVRGVPTYQMLSPAGDEVTRTSGYQEAEPFLQWLTISVAEVKAVLVRRKRSEEKLAAISQLLRESDAESTRQAVAGLFDLCSERDTTILEAAAARLAALAAREPAVLLDGLGHSRLVVRILAANLLRPRLGNEFDFDPWSDAATRLKAVAGWRAKLANAAPAAAEAR